MPDGFELLPKIGNGIPNPYIGPGSTEAINRLHDIVNGLATARFDTSGVVAGEPFNVLVLRGDDGGYIYKFIKKEIEEPPADENTTTGTGTPPSYGPIVLKTCDDDENPIDVEVWGKVL